MEIKLGTIYHNKTKKYVLPSLQEYGKYFEEKFTSLFKLAIGIGDFALSDMGIIIDHSIFILVDTKFSRRSFIETMRWLRIQDYYQFDYPFDDIHNGHLHMIVVKLPEKYQSTLMEFKEGNYSNMYGYEDIEKFFYKRPEVQQVFNKDPKLLVEFVDKVNDEYNTFVDYISWEGELEFPPKKEEEYFNVNLI